MFGFNYIKFDPMIHVIHYQNGVVKKQGKGLSFFYFAPNSSIIAIPVGSNDLPFIFKETTSDYQTVTIQGQITFKISDPVKLAEVLDFSVNENGKYKKDDVEKLSQRIINEAQTATTSFIQGIGLKSAISSSKEIEDRIKDGLQISEALSLMGVDILGVNVLAIKATPEMERALETETRERLQQKADEAVYERRNFAVEQERKIKETELSTEIAVEEKKKQISEKKMEAHVMQAQNSRKLREMKVEADVSIERQREELVNLKVENERKEAEIKAMLIDASLKPYKEMDWRTVQAMFGNGDAKQNIAMAFRALSENAQKIGNLNITPDLLEGLLTNKEANK